jgi:hypothetical protein
MNPIFNQQKYIGQKMTRSNRAGTTLAAVSAGRLKPPLPISDLKFLSGFVWTFWILINGVCFEFRVSSFGFVIP